MEFIVGGFREDDETAVGDVSEALAAIVTVEDILLKAMTQRELDGRCGDSVSVVAEESVVRGRRGLF